MPNWHIFILQIFFHINHVDNNSLKKRRINNMKAKVKLTHTVELVVEAETREQIEDWLNCTTPEEALDMAGPITEFYDEEIIQTMSDNAVVDYAIN